MSPLAVVSCIMIPAGVLLAWILSVLAKQTYYRPIRADEQAAGVITNGREEAKKAWTRRAMTFGGVYLVICILAYGIALALPKIRTVQAALNPSATPTVTFTPTMTGTPTITRTARPTGTPRATGTAVTVTPRVSATVAPTQTPKIITQYQEIRVTTIVQITKIVTVIVYQTVVVTPTWTPTITETGTVTETHTPTITPTMTLTPTPTPTVTETPTGTP